MRSMSRIAAPTPVTAEGHRDAVERLVRSYRAIPADSTVRLAKRSSNLFRGRRPTSTPGLDVSGLDTVLAVDRRAKTADVGGMCTYETLVAATLPLGLSPLVVPQLKTITVGGAVTGLGIESASFRNGLPHESVLEMDILTGAGAVVTATPSGEHADLFRGFPNSYGSLGYATRIRLELEPVAEFVAVRHVRFRSLADAVDAIGEIVSRTSYEGVRVDYLDGVVFSADECYLTLGRQTDEPGPTSDYRGMGIYYRSIQTRTTDRLTISDYLWRWDTDWFWCSRAFGAQQPLIRRLWPRRLRRSSVYWKLIGLDRRFDIGDRLERLHGRPPLERVVQDVEIPLDQTTDFLTWFLAEVPIEPIWLCPIRLRQTTGAGADHPWPLYPMHRAGIYVNVGFWSAVPIRPGADPGATNRLIEEQVSASGGHKSLYSDSFYDPATFGQLYGGPEYGQLKRRYDPGNRLLSLYEKAVDRR